MFSLVARRLPLRSVGVLRNFKPCTIQSTSVRAITFQRTATPVFYRSFASQPAAASAPAPAAPAEPQSANYNAPAGEDPEYPSFLAGPFGTPEKPVLVPAVGDSRIVGCVGGPGKEHELIWHEVVENHPLICVECGQVFKIRKMAPQPDLNKNPEDFMGH